MKRIIFLIAILAVITGAFIGFSQYNKKHKDLQKINADYTLEASSLFAAFSTNETEANKKYLSKIVELSGKVTDIKSSDDAYQLYLETDDPMFGIICDMEDQANENKIKIGDEIKIRGICSGFLMDVALNRCVIVD